MSYVNLYKPASASPPPDAPYYGPDPYDINWAFPLPVLETERIYLTPFIPALHADAYIDAVRGYEEDLYRYIPFDMIGLTKFTHWVENMMRRDPTYILFAVIDKRKPDASHPEFGGSIAGIFGLIQTSPQHLTSEIGPALVLPEFRGSGVSVDATRLLLKYCLDLPSASGLGLRRVQWTANPMNVPSVKLAQKVGLRLEGTIRWRWVLLEGKDGKETRKEDPVQAKGRDSATLSACWDDWEGGLRESTYAALSVLYSRGRYVLRRSTVTTMRARAP
ncbi:hypothetical protein PLICRDRAFT_39496 [Plicaturopsis crispa FD-325 SS-3]|nr:hypothetical protein PLICRDRAFT_39496 [Plicaturopsis crispa FD-325 SS-3]